MNEVRKVRAKDIIEYIEFQRSVREKLEPFEKELMAAQIADFINSRDTAIHSLYLGCVGNDLPEDTDEPHPNYTDGYNQRGADVRTNMEKLK